MVTALLLGLRLQDLVALLVLAAFFGFLGLAILRLRSIRKGLRGHEHRQLQLGGWRLLWPAWWPDPAPLGSELASEHAASAAAPAHGVPAWSAPTLDHDGRLTLWPLRGAPAEQPPAALLQATLDDLGARLDEQEIEEAEGCHGLVHVVEGRASIGALERAYLWLARIPGRDSASALLLTYRASVLYGLGDGYWLQEVAQHARQEARDAAAWSA